MSAAAPLVAARDLVKAHGAAPRAVPAVRGVSFDIARGETLALVGESGSGKTTTGRLLLRLLVPDAGTVRFDGTDLAALAPRAMRAMRRRLQAVFQDPGASLDPRQRVGDIVAEGPKVHGLARGTALRERAARVLEEVGLGADALDRRPHEFSGGQRQRIAIARALATDPELLVCDEPVASLDATVQAQVLQLLAERQRARGLACLFIAHDLAVVRQVADRVAVMFAGRIVELAPADALFAAPAHPYTRALLAAVPALVREGRPPSRAGRAPAVVPPLAPPPAATGCPYAPRCAHPHKDAACAAVVPPLAPPADDRHGRLVACLKPPIADPS